MRIRTDAERVAVSSSVYQDILPPLHDVSIASNHYESTAAASESNARHRHVIISMEMTESLHDMESRDTFDESDADINIGHDVHRPWTHWDHACAAAKIAPVWFLANWAYNSSLAYTTITSSTVLASTGSLFTFAFAVLTNDEQFGWVKFGGVVMGMGGSILTALGDSASSSDNIDANDEIFNVTDQALMSWLEGQEIAGAGYGDQSSSSAWNRASLWGDILGLLSAVGYGAYAVQTRILCPHDESLYSMQILLGYIGLICMVGLSPIALYQAASSTQLSIVVFGFLFIKGIFDNVISDYLWLRAVILTNATVATVGLGLTIPLAFLSDIFVTDQSGTVMTVPSVLGALCVLTGFILVNVGNHEEPPSLSRTYEALDSSSSLVPACPPFAGSSDGDTHPLEGEQELSHGHE